MKAIQITEKYHNYFVDIPKPEIDDEQLLIAVKYIGMCGSDLNTFKGFNTLVTFPRIPGHEISGTIVARGTNVPEHLKVGTDIVVVPYTSCGHCSSCKKGHINACKTNKTLGVQQEGGLCEYIAIHWRKALTVSQEPSKQLNLETMALIEPLAVGFHAVNRATIVKDDFVAVIGCGMIGMGAIVAACAQGAKVIAIDISDEKVALAKKVGASYVINSVKEDLMVRINEITNNNGVDVALEAVGHPTTFIQCIDIACFSGQIVYIGYAKEPVSYTTQLFNLKELTIMGSRNATSADMNSVVDYLQKKHFDPQLFITKVFPFEQADQVLPYWDEHREQVMKLLVKI